VTLSVTEAEYVAAVEVVQNMLFAWRVLQSIGLQVKTPMVIEIDNKGAVDLATGWTANSRTRHIATRVNFLRELKEALLLTIRWIPNQRLSSDIFTKNVGGSDFVRYRDVYVRQNPSIILSYTTKIMKAHQSIQLKRSHRPRTFDTRYWLPRAHREPVHSKSPPSYIAY
jgi:hypothetical protein